MLNEYGRGAGLRAIAVVGLAVSTGSFAACGGSQVAAPSGSTIITLATSATQLPFNGTATITAQLVNAGGGLPPDGTVVTFATTLGSLQPAEAATSRGLASVAFLSGPVSGTAVISATSGGSTTGSGGAVKLAVGAAAAARIGMTANPATIPFNGGSSTITATVVDSGGVPLASIPLTFSTSAGTLTSTAIKTDASGNAQTTLTTTGQAASVKAAIGASGSASGDVGAGTTGTVSVAVAPRPQPVVSVTPGLNPTAQTPVTFTISAVPAANSGTTMQDVMINFGDGERFDLGAVSGMNIVAQHVYQFSGTYTVSVTAVDTGGGSGIATAVLVVAPQAPLSVAIAFAPPIVAGANTIFTFTAAVMPATAVIASYRWQFGDGSALQTTTGNQVAHSFKNGGGPYTVQVTIISTQGQTADTFTIISP